MENRAKQFIPFDALKGFREALAERERIIVPKVELTEDKLEQLDRKIANLQLGDMVTVVYYERDEYLKITGMLSRIDYSAKVIKVVNKTIDIADIREIETEKNNG